MAAEVKQREGGIQARGRMAASKAGAVTFRNQVGAGWVCPPKQTKKYKKDGKNYVLLENPRWIEYGFPVGSGDTLGWKTEVITPDMVGQKIARFVSIEYKAEDGKPRKNQPEWHAAVWNAGGYSGFARSDDDVRRILSGEKVDP